MKRILNLHKYSIARKLRSLIGSGLALSSWPRGCKVFSQRPFLLPGKGMLLTADPVSRGRKRSHERQLYQDPGKDLVHPKLMAESNRKVAGSNFGTRLVFEAISSSKRPINNNLCIFYCTEIHSTPFWTRTHALEHEPLTDRLVALGTWHWCWDNHKHYSEPLHPWELFPLQPN